MCLSPIHLQIHRHLTPAAPQALQLRGYGHSHLSATPSRALHGDTAVLLPLLPALSDNH